MITNEIYMQNVITLKKPEDISTRQRFISVLAGPNANTDTLTRPLQIDPYFGSYGLTGYIFSIQGTPTHGLAVIDLERETIWLLPQHNRRYLRTVFNQRNTQSRRIYGYAIKLIGIAGLKPTFRMDTQRACLELPNK